MCLLALKKGCKSERGSEFKGTDLASAYKRTQYQKTADSEGLAGTSPKDIHHHTQINAKQKIVNVTFYFFTFFVLISFISVGGSYCPAQSGSNSVLKKHTVFLFIYIIYKYIIYNYNSDYKLFYLLAQT